MKTNAVIIIGFGLLSSVALGSKKEASMAKGGEKPQVIINDADWPPYFYGKDGVRAGLAKELLEICIPQAGFTPVFRFHPIERMVQMVKNGDIDITVFGSVHDEKRKEREVWGAYSTETLFSATYVPIVAANSNITIKNISDFSNLQLKLGVKQGLKFDKTFDDIVEERRKKSKTGIENYNLTTEGIEKLQASNRMDVFVEQAESVSSLAKDAGLLDKIKVLPFVVKKSDYVVVTSKASKAIKNTEEFGKKLDSCIAGLKKQKKYNEILSNYGIKP